MPRLLFEKDGESIYISHLDLMRVFQRAFRRAGLLLRHSQGFNPRAIVSIALPLSLGASSCCELLDFDLEGEGTVTPERINPYLPAGVRVREIYERGRKLKELTHLLVSLTMEYDHGAPEADAVSALFSRETLVVEKQSKKGATQVNLLPMVKSIAVMRPDAEHLAIQAVVAAQNPSLNPMLLAQAVEEHLGKADFSSFRRLEIFDEQGNIFR